jgi:predicted TIM-barrel enzyme
MSAKKPDPSGSGGSTAHDPAAAMVDAMRAVWDVGFAAMQTMAGGVSKDGRMTANPVSGLVGVWAEMLARGVGAATGTGAHVQTEAERAATGAVRQAVDVSPALAEASAIAAASTMRYMQGIAEVMARHQSSLMQAATGRITGEAALPPEQCHVLVDKLRGFLREVGETALMEARRLDHELAQLGESLAQSLAPAKPDDPYRRYHEAKS